MSRDARYSFESRPTRQTEQAARRMLRTFLVRLGVTPEDHDRIGPNEQKALLTFTTVCHLNISWYDKSRKREQRWYWGFAAFTVLLLIGTPVIIFLAHYLNAKALTAQIGVIIAGVLSAHRMLSTMFEKRNLVRHFWRAQADLKTILYSFEDTWRGRALYKGSEGESVNTDSITDAGAATADAATAGPEPAEEPLRFDDAFMEDLKAQIQQARQIKRQEQDEFFARYDSAFSNLGDVLGVVHKQSTEAVSSLYAQRSQRAEQATQTRAEIAELEAQKHALTTQLEKYRRDLESLQGADTTFDKVRQSALTSAIESLHREHLDTAFRLQSAHSRLQHLAPR